MKKIIEILLSLVLVATRGANLRRQFIAGASATAFLIIAALFLVVGLLLIGRSLYLAVAVSYGDITATSTVGVVALLISAGFILLVRRCWR